LFFVQFGLSNFLFIFTIYINDLDDNITNKLLKFAHDSKIWGPVNTINERNILQEDLNKLGEWSVKNQMPFNVNKCKVLHIGKTNIKADYILMGETIPSTKDEKDLGVFFDENYKPTFNCNKSSKSASKIVGMIKRNITSRNSIGMMTLYKTLVRPILDYCIPVCRPYLRKDITKLEKVQKRFTKVIDCCRGKTYAQRLKVLGITSLEDRHYRADMIKVLKILNDQCNIYPTNFLELNKRDGRKNAMKLFKKRSKLDVCKYSFTSRVVDHWNELPDAVVLSADVNAFKNNFDHLLRDSRGQS